LAEGGTPPLFLIIDDGWQQIGSKNKESSRNDCRLHIIVCQLCSGGQAKLNLVSNGACRTGLPAG